MRHPCARQSFFLPPRKAITTTGSLLIPGEFKQKVRGDNDGASEFRAARLPINNETEKREIFPSKKEEKSSNKVKAGGRIA